MSAVKRPGDVRDYKSSLGKLVKLILAERGPISPQTFSMSDRVFKNRIRSEGDGLDAGLRWLEVPWNWQSHGKGTAMVRQR